MKTYNHALDYMALALQAHMNEKFELSAKLLIKASRQKDAEQALQVIEASNAAAYEANMAVLAKAKAQLAAKKQVKADVDIDVEDDDDDLTDEELGAGLVEDIQVMDEEPLDQEQLAGDLDELDDVEDEESLVEVKEGDSTGAAFAAVLASMRASAAKKVAKK